MILLYIIVAGFAYSKGYLVMRTLGMSPCTDNLGFVTLVIFLYTWC